MNNIFDIYRRINWITDKYLNGFNSPEDISKALDAGQMALFNYFLPLKENGDDIATTALIPFKTSTSLTSNGSGLLTYPVNYSNTEAIYEDISGIFTSVIPILHVELANAMNSALYPIALNPRYIEEQNGVQLYPKTVQTVDFHYLSVPTTPVIGYTIVGNEPVYDPTTSVQLQFDVQYWMDVLLRGLPYIGVNLSDQDVIALSALANQNNPPQ